MARSDNVKKVFHENAILYQKKFADQSQFHALLQEFAHFIIQPSPSILDVGCGPGNVIRLIKELIPNSQITGIDFAPGMIDLAQKTVPEATFHVHDIRTLSTLGLPQFDGIICSFCLPYLTPDEAIILLKHISSLTLPKGVLYLSTMESSQENSAYVKPSNNVGPGIFTNYYERAFLLNLLHECGFQINRTKQIDPLEDKQTEPKDLVILAQKLP